MSDLHRKEAEAQAALNEALGKLQAFQESLRSECNDCAVAQAQGEPAPLQQMTARLGNVAVAIQRFTEAQMWFDRKS